MQIYKHIHSCLVVEKDDKIALFDPGKYSFQESLPDLSFLRTLDYILITHDHGDHMHIPFIKQLLERFPQARVISNSDVKEKLERESFSVELQDNVDVQLTNRLHEISFDKNSVKNTIFTVFGSFIHSGDNIEYPERAEVMTLPIDCGMWGNVSVAVERLIKLKPKYIVPIHEYRLKKEVIDEIFLRMSEYFNNHGIIFLPLSPTEKIDIQV